MLIQYQFKQTLMLITHNMNFAKMKFQPFFLIFSFKSKSLKIFVVQMTDHTMRGRIRACWHILALYYQCLTHSVKTEYFLADNMHIIIYHRIHINPIKREQICNQVYQNLAFVISVGSGDWFILKIKTKLVLVGDEEGLLS